MRKEQRKQERREKSKVREERKGIERRENSTFWLGDKRSCLDPWLSGKVTKWQERKGMVRKGVRVRGSVGIRPVVTGGER